MANYFPNENLKNFKGSKKVYYNKKIITKGTIINLLYIVYSYAFISLENP